MATPDRGGDLDAACRALEAALRARLLCLLTGRPADETSREWLLSQFADLDEARVREGAVGIAS